MSEELQTNVSAGVVDPQPAIEQNTKSSPVIPTGARVKDSADEGGDDVSAKHADVVDQKSKQSADVDRAFAELRREKERMEKQLKERDAWIASQYGETHGITTWDEYRAAVEMQYRQQQTAEHEKAEQELRDQGYDVDALRQIIKLDPEFQELKRQNEAYQRAERDKLLEQHFEELKTEFPAIKKPEDIDKDTWAKYARGNGALSLVEAYAAVNRKELIGSAKVSGEKDALTKIGSKDHLTSEKSGGGDLVPDVEIPPEKMRIWTMLGYNIKQIRERERKYMKSGGK
jgi:uncharacterized protein (UPF0335 family)